MLAEDADYYAVFCDSDLKWVEWLKPGFRHCYIMRKEFGKVWTVIQSSQHHLEVRTYLVEDYPKPEDFAKDGAIVVKVGIQKGEGLRGHLCHFNCVEVVKAVLGIRKPFIFTPYQLYRWLYGQRYDSRREGQTEESCEATISIDQAAKTRSTG